MAAKTTRYWLMKSEPDEYSIADLARDTTSLWEGVRNYQVRNFFRDEMRVGDVVLFYHSNTTQPGVVGEAEVIEVGLADPWQFDAKSEYYDQKSSQDNPRWLAPRIRYRETYTRVASLNDLRELPIMADSPLVRKGNRLSVVPLSKAQFSAIKKMATR